MTCRGGPEYVIANGRIALDEGQLKAVQGYGNFVSTPVFSPFVYDAVSLREQAMLLLTAHMSTITLLIVDKLQCRIARTARLIATVRSFLLD